MSGDNCILTTPNFHGTCQSMGLKTVEFLKRSHQIRDSLFYRYFLNSELSFSLLYIRYGCRVYDVCFMSTSINFVGFPLWVFYWCFKIKRVISLRGYLVMLSRTINHGPLFLDQSAWEENVEMFKVNIDKRISMINHLIIVV